VCVVSGTGDEWDSVGRRRGGWELWRKRERKKTVDKKQRESESADVVLLFVVFYCVCVFA